MIPYLFHVSILVAACYLFYRVFLQKETYFQINRFVLIGCILVAFALPFLEIPEEWSLRDASISKVENPVFNKNSKNIFFENNNAESAFSKEKATKKSAEKTADNFEKEVVQTTDISPQPIQKSVSKLTLWQVLKYGYFIGLAIFAVNFLLQLAMLIFKMLTKPSIKDGSIRIVEVEKDKAPFSFLNSIFLNPEKYEWDTYSQILEHEKIHIHEGHTWDILLAELLVIVQWFNPFAWWYRRAVENNLEYLTDQKMLAKGTNAESYQMNLLKVSVPHLPLSLTTNYNTSFLKKRIFMMNQQKSSASSSWKYFFLFPLLGLSVITFNSVTITAQNTPKSHYFEIEESAEMKEAEEVAEAREIQEVQEIAEMNQRWPQYNQDIGLLEIIGEWDAEIEDGLLCYKFLKKKHREMVYWERRFCIDKPDFSKIDGHSYTMTRAAGTVDFKGKVTAKGGKGTYTFTPNLDFQSYLKSEGFDLEEKALFHCCLTDIDKEYLAYLKQQNYDLSSEELTDFAVHDIDLKDLETYIPGMKKLGFERLVAQDLIALSIHEVDLKYVAEMKDMLKQDLTIDNVVSAAIHDIDPDYIRQFRAAGFDNLDFDELIGFAIHDINPAYIKSLRQAGLDLDTDEITAAGIHGIDAAYIEQFQKAGFDDLDFDELIGFAIHDIDPAYIKSLQQAGLDLDTDEITAAGIHGIDAAYIEQFQKAGFDDLDFDELIGFAIHDIDPAYIKSLQQAGLDLDTDEITAAGIHGIDAAYIEQFQKAGFDDLDFDELIGFAIHDIDPAYIKSLQQSGLDLDTDEITAAGIHGVDAAYIEQFQKAGVDNLDFDELIGFAIHDIDPAYIKSLQNAGLENLDIDEITAAGIHGVEVEFIKEMKNVGFEELEMDEIVGAKIHDVDSDFIKKVNAQGYKFEKLEDYVELKLKMNRREFNQYREE